MDQYPENSLALIKDLFFNKNGEDIFEKIVVEFPKLLNIDYILIGQSDLSTGYVQSVAVAKQGQLLDNFKYHLENTPCENVFNEQRCLYPHNITNLFPKDQLLADLKVEGYIGHVLKNKAGEKIGLIVGLSESPLKENENQLNVFSIIAEHVGLELQQKISLDKLEMALNEKENLQKVLNKHNLISTADLKGNILSANNTFCETSGFRPEELIGQNHRIVKSDEHPKEFYQKLWQTISAGEVWQGVLKNKKKNNDFYWVNATISPMKDSEGNITHYVSARTDITQQILLQEKSIKLKQQAESLAQSKSMFLANMSHEVRTPMNGIQGSISLLLDTELNGEQKEISHMIYHSMQSLNIIVNDILDFSKLDSGKVKLEKISLNYQLIVDDVLNLFSEQAHKKGLQLIKEFPEDHPSFILGDPTRLRQILINLVSNALKFTKEGRVSIIVEFEKLTDQEYHIHTTIKDTGIGMTKEQLEHIFDPFQQADNTTTRLYGGTGLGTSICKSLIELQGGSIQVQSKLNEGSKFSFTIPTESTNKKFVHQELVQKPKRNYDKTVILAEDNLINLKLAKRALEKLGIEVLVAKNGKEAIDIALNEPHDMILMDIQMPIINGIDATKTLLEQGYDKPITPMTANIMEDDLLTYKEIGMLGHIPKPFKVHDIVNVLDGIIGPRSNIN